MSNHADDLMDSVTLYHGTSEAFLYALLRNGFAQPPQSANDVARALAARFLPDDQITDSVLGIIERGTRASYRKLESNGGHTLFATTSARTAQGFANMAEYGGELGLETARALRSAGYDIAPCFAAARPVVLEIEVPVSALAPQFRDWIAARSRTTATENTSYDEILITDAAAVTIKGVSIGDGPQLLPQQAESAIHPQFKHMHELQTSAQKASILQAVYGFRHRTGAESVTVKHDGADIAVAQTVGEDADGNPVFITIPDMDFEPAWPQLANYGFVEANAYAMPHGLTAREIKSYGDVIMIDVMCGDMTQQQGIAALAEIWRDLSHENTSLQHVTSPVTLTNLHRAITLAAHDVAAADIAHTLLPTHTAGYEAERTRTLNATGLAYLIDWNPAPQTLAGINDEMARKLERLHPGHPPASPRPEKYDLP